MFPFSIVPPFVISEKESIRQIACSSDNTILLSSKGNVYVTGLNRVGELGVGDSSNRNNTWVLVMQGANHIAAIRESLFAFRADGTVWSPNLTTFHWEDVTAAQFANVGDMSSDNIKQVISDTENLVIWKKDNSTWYKGNNGTGQAGNSSTGNIGQSIKMKDGVVKLSVAGNTIVLLLSDGFLYGAGNDPRGVIKASAGTITSFTKMFGPDAESASIVDFTVATGGQAILVRYSSGKYRTKGLNIGQLASGTANPGNTLTEVPSGFTPGNGTEPLLNNISAVLTGGTYPNYSYPLYYFSSGTFYAAGSVRGGLAGINASSGTTVWTPFDSSSVSLVDIKGISFGTGWVVAYNDTQIMVWGSTSSASTIPIVGYVPVPDGRPAYRVIYATSPIGT